jgi:hypothetical protein
MGAASLLSLPEFRVWTTGWQTGGTVMGAGMNFPFEIFHKNVV